MTRAACLAKVERIANELGALTKRYPAGAAQARDLNLLMTVATAGAELRELLPELGRALANESRLATSAGTVEVCR